MAETLEQRLISYLLYRAEKAEVEACHYREQRDQAREQVAFYREKLDETHSQNIFHIGLKEELGDALQEATTRITQLEQQLHEYAIVPVPIIFSNTDSSASNSSSPSISGPITPPTND